MKIYEAPLSESVALLADGGILQDSGFGNAGEPGSDLITDDPLPFGLPSLLGF